MIVSILAVAAGGFLGGAGRYGLTRVLPSPVCTFVANMLGALALGLTVGFFREHAWLADAASSPAYAFLAVGFAGGLSTWSTLARELGDMLASKQYRKLLTYTFFTLAVGLVTAWRGTIWATRIVQGW